MRTINQAFKVVQLNAENLFVFMDFYQNEKLSNLTEVQWQNLSGSTQSNKPLLKTRWLAEAITDMDPDLLLICEVGGWESAQNFNHYFLQDRYEVLMAEGNSDRGIDVAYFLKRNWGFSSLLLTHKDKLLDFNYPLDPPEKNHSFSRDALELRLFQPQSSEPWLCAFNLHLKSKLDREGIDPYGRSRRKAELRAFLEVFRASRKELGEKTEYLIGGDFNGIHSPSALKEPEFDRLHEEENLLEVFEACGVPQEERATQIQFQGQKPIPLQIDGIWVSKSLQKALIRESTGVYLYKSDLGVKLPYVRSLGQRLAMPSDHYPVMTSINLEEITSFGRRF